MYSTIHKIAIVFIGFLFLISNKSSGQSDRVQQEAILLQKALDENHYSPRILDDTLSKEIFLNYLASLDKHHLYFTAEDINDLSKLQLKLDDELKSHSWEFFPLVANIYKDRLSAAEKLCKNLIDKPFDFTVDEIIMLPESKGSYAKDENELSLRWSQWLKYQVLWQLVNSFETEDSSEHTDKQLLQNEAEIRNKVLRAEIRKIKKILEHPQGFKNHLKTLYFNAITACYDPHSVYLSKTELENFQSQLSTEAFSFGIDLDENEMGDIEILRLVPGGPAWKSNELHKGDVLLKLKWLNKEEYDLSGADLMEVEDILQASNTDFLGFTVRNSGGNIKTVNLKKEKIREDENIVKSFIIKGDNKIGYISLPGFYTAWNNEIGHGCANDVAKEILKLKKEKVEGLILDLRYNGGGSLEEGLNLAGIFIDEGPLLVTQGKDGKPNIIKDFNRGTVYDGPLLVMVNGQSASASELLASTLQDYNRAIIVGSPTFGKSTSQAIIPIDPNIMDVKNDKSPYGFATITKDKIFRITGKTAQLLGVQPDVYLPDVFEIFGYREETLPNALSNDFISKSIVFAKLPAFPDSILQINSQNRLLKHEGFNKILELQKSPNFRSVNKLKEIPLNISFFRNLNNDQILWNNLLDYALKVEVKAFTVENPPFNIIAAIDTYGKEINDDILKSIQSDIYIEESFLILSDLIKHNNKK